MVHTTRPRTPADLEQEWPFSHANLSVAALVEESLRQGNTRLVANGALNADTGSRTGRSVKDKFIVRDTSTVDVDWGGLNQQIDPYVAGRLQERVARYLGERNTYVLDAWAGADPDHRVGVRVVAEYGWHALFAHQLFLRTTSEQRIDFQPGFTILAAPDFLCDPIRDGVPSEAAIVLDFARRLVIIAGTQYAGEIKKSVFSYLNFVLPSHGVLPMHCSASVGTAGDVALFFGLSGTGKTTLSADPERRLIGDDEHGWGSHGVFNFEGGCYAKCVHLRRESEPQIFDAIRFGAVLENVILDPFTREPDYDDVSLTENTRAAYPIDFIPGADLTGMAGHPSAIVFLTADAFGVLPPLARLSTSQALYYFLSGYTAKLAGTEAGMGSDPEATFSACFAAPFLALPPLVYADMLRERLERHGTRCYLLNTGWSGGPASVGRRIDLHHTRAMVRAALSGELEARSFWTDPVFGLQVPDHVSDVPDRVLRPAETWTDRSAYERAARELAARFRQNFMRFSNAEQDVVRAGPRE